MFSSAAVNCDARRMACIGVARGGSCTSVAGEWRGCVDGDGPGVKWGTEDKEEDLDEETPAGGSVRISRATDENNCRCIAASLNKV